MMIAPCPFPDTTRELGRKKAGQRPTAVYVHDEPWVRMTAQTHEQSQPATLDLTGQLHSNGNHKA